MVDVESSGVWWMLSPMVYGGCRVLRCMVDVESYGVWWMSSPMVYGGC